MPSAEQKVLVLESRGAPQAIQTKPVSAPGAGQLLVRVEAAGLNPADWKISKHDFPGIKLPTSLGFEGAGVIEEVGDGVQRLKPGDRMSAF
jgi:NADPH:quinone reductase-like Zn-dependent oxidoreductase